MDGKAGLQTKLAQARMVVRPAAKRPMKFAVGLGDWMHVDARKAQLHQTLGVKLPVLVAVGTEPLTTIVMIFVGEADSDAVAA